MMTEARHDRQRGTVGEFAHYVDACRSTPPSADIATFRDIRYVNTGLSRLFPLRNCRIDRGEIRGQMFWMNWIDCHFSDVDLSHTHGHAHWSCVRFERCLFHHLMASVSAADTSFVGCRLHNVVLNQPVFVQCTFEKTKISGTIRGAIFIDCEFRDVDLKGSVWVEPKTLDIRGTWKNGDAVVTDAIAKARSFFG